MTAMLLKAAHRGSDADDLWPRVEREAARLSVKVEAARAAERLSLMGCGFHGRHAAATLRGEGRELAGFFDNDPKKQDTMQEGLPVLPLAAYRQERHGFVLITARHVVPLLSRQLSQAGIDHLSYDAFFVARHLGRLQIAREKFFAEAESKRVFDTLLLAMLTGDAAPIAAIVSPDQYFHFPKEARVEREVFVDAGAHDGDTVAAFLDFHKGRFERIVAIEPTPSTFAALERNVAALGKRWSFSPERVTLVNAGVGAEPMTLALAADAAMPTSNALVPTGKGTGETIAVLPLDQIVADQTVSFLKADVEGMELAMLYGARRMISVHRPKLAVSLYHRLEDFFDIPGFITELSGDYRFRLRHHTASLLETVLYAYAGDQPSDSTQ